MPVFRGAFARASLATRFEPPDMGWGNFDNGDLLDAMTGRFDVLVTVDKRLPDQQHIRNRPFGVVVLQAKSNRLSDLLPLVPQLLKTLSDLQPGMAKEVAG